MTILLEIQKELKNLPLEKQNEVLNFVLFLRQRTTDTQSAKQPQETPADIDQEQGEHIKAAFQTLAKLDTFADIDDPVEWQRQLRQDRP